MYPRANRKIVAALKHSSPLEWELKEIQEKTSFSQQTTLMLWKEEDSKGWNHLKSKWWNSKMKTTDEKPIIFITFYFAAHEKSIILLFAAHINTLMKANNYGITYYPFIIKGSQTELCVYFSCFFSLMNMIKIIYYYWTFF